MKLVQEKPALLPPHHQPTVLHQCLAVLKRELPDPTSGHLDQVRTGRVVKKMQKRRLQIVGNIISAAVLSLASCNGTVLLSSCGFTLRRSKFAVLVTE